MTAHTDVLLEGGGSRTWIALADHSIITSATGPSTNPQSVGVAQAERTMGELLGAILRHRPATGVCHLIAAHGAASTQGTARRFADLLLRTWTHIHASPVTIQVTNDITALLLAHDSVCVAIAGTGTGYAARHGQRFARASGLEWLLSDEGGGYDLAVAGLRAAVRSLDGRGPHTALTDAARTWAGGDTGLPAADVLFDKVYAEHAKPQVATFATQVLTAAEAGDRVAGTLLDHAADEIAAGIYAVRHAVGLEPGAGTLILAGSLLTRTPILADRVRHRLDPRLIDQTPHHEHDPAQTMLGLRHAWHSGQEPLPDSAAIACVTIPAPA